MTSPKNNHNLYEKFVPLYEFFFKPFFIKGVKKTIAKIEDQGCKSVLESGVGPGYSLEYYPKTMEIFAYDISRKMVEEAQKKSKTLPHVTVLNPEELEELSQEKKFSAVVTFSVMSVVPNPQEFLSTLGSFCQTKGYLFIIMHSRGQGFRKILDLIFEWPCRLLFGFSLLRDIEDLDLNGYKLIEKKPVNLLFSYPLSHLMILQKV